ncbi:hypothetical protein ACF09J_32070 [Streptomyces sp. NPDC014889]|uniref:hypothetical protein n=1 Tax=Streptomyces sp. NPDC014889 TaxID=3364928 RepID=UPI0036FAD14C
MTAGCPTGGQEGQKAPLTVLWLLSVTLREKTLHESAARAEEILCLNVEDLHPCDKRGRTLAKGGPTEWIHWQSGAAQLL